MINESSGLTKGSAVRILKGDRTGQVAIVNYIRMAPPDFANIEVASLVCLDGRQSIYPIEHFEKI